MKTILLFIALPVSTLLIISCSKEIRNTNKIHGTWNVTSLQQYDAGGDQTLSAQPDGVMQFNKCDVIDDDYRAFRQQYTYSGHTGTVTLNETGSYRFEQDGAVLVVRIPSGGDHEHIRYNVTTLERKKAVLERQHEDNSKTIITLNER